MHIETNGSRYSRRVSSTSPQLTLDDAVEIHRRRWLGEAQHNIAAGFHVNPGRVSEILNGKRFPEARDIAMKGR